MDELDHKIIEILGKDRFSGEMPFIVRESIKEFISKCSISDFEKLKDMEYDLSQNKE